MTGAPELAVVTVLYRSREALSKTLPTWLAAARGRSVEFVFVDHAPDDGCAELIADCFGGAGTGGYRYLPDPANPGFAAGCNRGMAAVSAPHAFLLNPDVWLNDDTLAAVADAVARAPGQPLAVGLSMRGDEYTGIELNPVSLFNDRRSGSRREPVGPSGGAAVFPVALFQRFGGFAEELFAWGEDADLALRLFAAGIRTRTLDLALPHAWGHSVEGDRGLGALRAYLLARNRLLVAARTFSGPLLLLALPVLALAHGALAVRRVRQGTLAPFLRGVGRGVRVGWRARRGWRGRRLGVAGLIAHVTNGGIR